jgi:hypothetical protein
MRVDVGTRTDKGTVAKVLHTAKVLHESWEMDNEAWAVEFEDGTRAVLTTSHGGLYVADRAEFEDKLRETEESAASIRTLLGLMA